MNFGNLHQRAKSRISRILIRVLRFFCSHFKSVNWFLLLGTPIAARRLSGKEKHVIYPAARMRTEAPETLHYPVHRNFLPERYFPEVSLIRLKDGISTGRGYNINSSGELIAEASVETHFYPLFYPEDEPEETLDLEKYEIWNKPIKPPAAKHSGSVATLTNLWTGYFHWLFEVLPRVHLLELSGIKPDRLYVDTFQPFQKETLRLLGYSDSDLIDASDKKCIYAEELIVPSVPGITGIVPPWVCKYLREKFLLPVSDHDLQNVGSPRFIYISRARANHRRCTNEDEVAGLLRRFGFQCVFLETLKFQEQVDLLSGADVVVACHGGGLSNIVFCRPGAVVIEIFSPVYVNPCYWQVSQAVDLKYYYLLGEGETIIPEGLPWIKGAGVKDITVGIDDLEKLVESVLACKSNGVGCANLT